MLHIYRNLQNSSFQTFFNPEQSTLYSQSVSARTVTSSAQMSSSQGRTHSSNNSRSRPINAHKSTNNNFSKFSHTSNTASNSNTYTNTTNSITTATTEETNCAKPFYLFYFLKPSDLVITMIIDIICKLRLRYANKGTNNFKRTNFYLNYSRS